MGIKCKHKWHLADYEKVGEYHRGRWLTNDYIKSWWICEKCGDVRILEGDLLDD